MKKLLFSFILFTQISFSQVGQQPPNVTQLYSTSSLGGAYGHFQVVGFAAKGLSDLQFLAVAIGYGGTPQCYVMLYQRSTILLLNDAQNDWLGWFPVGSNNTVENAQCKIQPLTTAVTLINGYTADFRFDVTFKSGFNGVRGVWGWAGDANWANSGGWYNGGAFTVSAANFDNLSTSDVTLQDQILDDYDGTYVTRPSSIHPWSVRLKSGKVVKIAAADNFQMKNFSYSHEISGNSFIYRYVMDTKPLWMWRLGQTTEFDAFELDPSTKTLSAPPGWSLSPGGSDSVSDDAVRSESSEFVLQSDWRPGILPMYLCDAHAKEPIPYFPDTNSNERLSKIGIFTNSQQRFVIGPAIRPGASPDDIKTLLKHWVDDYGFNFLQPLLEDGKTLDDVKTDDPFEQEVLACLRAAQSK